MALRKTWTEMLTSIRANLDEASPGFWTDAGLLRMANRQKDRVWSEVRRAQQDYFTVTRTSLDGALTTLGTSYAATGFQIVASTRDYTLPPDLAQLVTIEVITSGFEHLRFSFRPATDPQFRQALTLTDAMEPEGFLYTLLGERTMRITPPSNRTLDLRLTYVAIVPDLTVGADTLEMPHPLYRAVEEYTCAQALMADRAPEAAAWEARGNATVASFLGSNDRQSTDPEFVAGYLENW